MWAKTGARSDKNNAMTRKNTEINSQNQVSKDNMSEAPK
jgi:hypothetical protein